MSYLFLNIGTVYTVNKDAKTSIDNGRNDQNFHRNWLRLRWLVNNVHGSSHDGVHWSDVHSTNHQEKFTNGNEPVCSHDGIEDCNGNVDNGDGSKTNFHHLNVDFHSHNANVIDRTNVNVQRRIDTDKHVVDNGNKYDVYFDVLCLCSDHNLHV